MVETTRQDHTTAETWLFRESRRVRGLLVRTVGWSVLSGLLIIAQARLLALVCHRIVIGHALPSAVAPLICTVMLLAAARGGALMLSERDSAAAAAAFKKRLRSLLYRRIQALESAGEAGTDTASLIESVTSGVEGVEPYVARFLPHLALAAVLPLMTLAALFATEWSTGLILLFSAPSIPLFMFLIGRGSERLNRLQWRELTRMSGHLLDLVQGLPDLKVLGAVKREAAMVAQVSEQYRRATMAVLRLAFLSAFALEFFATVGTALVAVMIGFQLLGRTLALTDGLFVLLLAPEFYLPLRTLGLSYHSRMQGVAAAERIVPLLTRPLPEGYGGTIRLPDVPPTVCFEGVSFRYGGQRGGVTGINLELPSGSITALAGESGAGKTTLARLLVGLIRPERGRVLVNGIDLARLEPDAWRSRLAWVSQNPVFFAGTIRDNLLMGRPEAAGQDLEAALEAAALSSRITRLPRGLDTELGERGAGLSGGELRRLALARAFLRNAFLVVLDEPTAGLDRDNELLVGRALQRLAVDRTVLVISHREEILRSADRVAVVVGGRIDRILSSDEAGDWLGATS
jgi:ATP-binding cassette subfamily C protein CydD